VVSGGVVIGLGLVVGSGVVVTAGADIKVTGASVSKTPAV
jgi:acetyltransferase-like isoleucine patch superfamily enzyme